MKRLTLLCTLVYCLTIGQKSHAQDFSNKGKDFWVAYGYHQVMVANNVQEMVLYFSTEAVTTVTVSIPGNGYTQTFSNIPANTVFTTPALPKFGAQDARLINETGLPENKGIHIVADKPIVAYAHIYNSSVSGATILFPTNTLGKEYYSINYDNVSNTGQANCWFYVVACDTGTTTVEITPSANTLTKPAGVPFTVNLTQGQTYNMMGQLLTNTNPFRGVDLTGSSIRSIDVGNGCKRIGVFSGSGRISLTCNGASSSSDNYMVQAFPKTAWGKRFLTAPTGGSSPNNFFRVCVSDPTTVVRLNGSILTGLVNNFYYQAGPTSSPNYIEADKPITVAQYLTSQGACNNSGQGDPEVIYLSPIEQNINKVLWNATPNFAINQHYINAIIPNTGTAISSLRLDGVPVSPVTIQPHPQLPGYSYLKQGVTAGQHTLQSDSGFNAIAYGYGPTESYGYNAGTNIKDLFQFITVQNQHATVSFPTACKSSPFFLSMVFPYQPTSLIWQFNGLFPNVSIPSPMFDSSWVVSGKTLYRYKLPTPYTINTVGTYPVRIVATNPTPDGCGNQQEIDFDLQVFENPTAEFAFTTDGCLTNPVLFRDSALNTQSRPITNYWWDFADAGAISTLQNPIHTFSAAGTYNVKHTIITDVGCISDTVSKPISISNPPVAGFTVAAPKCVGKLITFTNASTVPPGGVLSQWLWDFGDGNTANATNGNPQAHTYLTAGSYNVTLRVVTSSGCQSQLFSLPVVINVNPVAGFNFPGICLPVGAAQFTNTSVISDGTGSQLTYNWDFGDGNTSTQPNPLHNYSGTGPFTVTLTAISNNGCADDSVRILNTIFARPTASFTVDSIESCIGGTSDFTNASTAPGSSVTQWFWDFGDASTSTLQNPTHTYAGPGNYIVKLWINSAVGCRSDTMIKIITVLPLPTVNFTNGTPVCQFGNLSLNSTSVSNGGVINQYSWTVNTVPAGGNNASIVYVPVIAGPHMVNLTVTTDKGCSNQSSRSVTVNPKPVAAFNFPNICLPVGAAQFVNTTTISDGTGAQITYTWNFGDGNTSTQTNPLHNYSGTGPFTVTLIATSNNGCIDNSVRVVNTVYAEPQAAFNSLPEVCLGNSISFTDQSTAANATVNSWQWDFGDGNTSTVQNPSHTYAAAGSYTVTLKVGTDKGCQTVALIATRTVIVNPLPIPAYNTSAPLCQTRGITFTDISNANAGVLTTWRWNFGDGSTSILTTGTPFTHTYANAGTYPTTLQVETNKGCVSTVLMRDVVINNRPKAGFVAPEICLTDPFAPFLDTSSIAAGSITGWDWNFGDPNANAGNPNTSTVQNPSHRYTVVGVYTATLVSTSAAGCKDTIAQTFTVNGSIPVAGFAVSNPNILCSNKTVTITDGSTVDFGNLIKVEIYWDFANDPTIKTTASNPVSGATYTHTYPEFGTPFTKTYTVRYVVYSGINCVNTTTKTITVLATPTVVFNPVNAICDNLPSFNISQATITNGLPGTGVFTGTGVTSGGSFDPAAAGPGPHTITYTYTGTNTCVNSATQTITVNPSPNANAGPDKFVLEGGVVTLTPTLFTGMQVSYTWTPTTYLSSANIANAIVQNPLDDITYTLKVTTDQGCFDTDDVFVKVLKAPVVPNAFSPNGDGTHDKWDITFLESYPGCVIDVYNRYGQLVYHTVNYPVPWDGKINGRDAPVGTYYYIINPKNGRKPLTGYVDIIR
ncbi:MAG: PKD domain-containing protein [Bacteroidetes bacterium]|nr:MAG: PKD domain-containing protein [Bacteroidota bacterium]